MALIFNDRDFSFSAMFNRIETACPRNGKLQGAKRLCIILKYIHQLIRVREYLKFSVRYRTDRMQISASPTKKLMVLQFVKLLTTKDD